MRGLVPLSPSLRFLADLTVPTQDAADRLERDWSPESPPDTVAGATLAKAFGLAISDLARSDIEAVGTLVETFLVTGDEDTKDAITTGFLESLLAQASAGTIHFRSIAWMLGPESIRYCREWDKFTGLRTDGVWENSST